MTNFTEDEQMKKHCLILLPFIFFGLLISTATRAVETCEATADLIKRTMQIPCLNVIQEVDCSDKTTPDENGICIITTPYTIRLEQRGSILQWEITNAIEEFDESVVGNSESDGNKAQGDTEEDEIDSGKTQEDETIDEDVTEEIETDPEVDESGTDESEEQNDPIEEERPPGEEDEEELS